MDEKGLLNSSQAAHQFAKKGEVTSGNTWRNCLNLYMNCQRQDISMKSERTKIATELGVCPVHSKGFE